MERPRVHILTLPDIDDGEFIYKAADIDPLLEELERLKADKKPFPSYQEFEDWAVEVGSYAKWSDVVYDYFSQFQYEKTVYPKVGDMIEGEDGSSPYRGKFKWIELDNGYAIWNNIRTVTTTTREEVIAQVESKLKSNELTFDRELVEQFLQILKGRDNDL